MQRRLTALYGLDVQHDVHDFLITERRLAEALGGVRREVSEELLIVEGEGGAEVALYLEQAMLDRLGSNDPDEGLDAANLGDFWTAFEGVSHFIYFVFKAGRDQSVSLLEMELQAEIDKFIMTALMCRDRTGSAPDLLHRLLFDAPRLADDLSRQEAERYRQANRYAGRYCRKLWPAVRRGRPADELIREIRRFYRFARPEKLGHIEARTRSA